MKIATTKVAGILAIGLLAGCGGSGSSSPGTPPGNGGGGAPTTQNGKTRASLTIVIGPRKSSKSANVKHVSASGRKRDYVAPTTQGIIAEFVGSDSTSDVTYQGYTLAANAVASSTSPASCGAVGDDGSFTCTLSFVLAPNITYATTLTAYDVAQSGTGATPATGSNALSTATQNLTISASTANAFAFTLSGIVEGFTVSPQYVGVGGSSSGTGIFQALDADGNPIDQYDSSTAYAYGSQPSGPFSAASFAVVAGDEDEACAAQATAKKRARKRRQAVDASPCLTTTSTAVTDPTSESVSYAYNGDGYGGDGTSNNPPYYGEITLTAPTSYAGFNSNGSAASLFIVPLFGVVDQNSPYATGPASVSFAPGQSITGFATQFHPPSIAPADGSGYSVDASSCGSIATVGPSSYTAGIGISFTIAAGSAGGTCTLTLSDNGTSAGADTATITVTNTATTSSPSPSPSPTASDVPVALVQSNTGINTVSLPNDVTAGDTLVLAIENFGQESNAFPTSYGNFNVFPAAEDESTSVYLEDVTSSGPLASFGLGGATATGGTTYWIGEFSHSSSAAITSANSAINGVGGETVTITPNAPEGLILVAAENGSNSVPNNYQQFTEATGSGSQIQVDLAEVPTTDTTDPVTFDFGTNADSESAIQVAPAAFSGTQGMVRRRAIDPTALRRHASRLRALLQGRSSSPVR
jgi:hypothetical protein